jgi:hypothetical protein
MQILRVVLAIGLKPLLDGSLGRQAARERNRKETLARIDAAAHPGSQPPVPLVHREFTALVAHAAWTWSWWLPPALNGTSGCSFQSRTLLGG